MKQGAIADESKLAKIKENFMTRRGFALSCLVLAGCQVTTVGMSRVATSQYDGDYDFSVGRLGRDTAFYRSTGNAGREEELARLTLRSEGGIIRIVSLQDNTNAGPNFSDFTGAFYDSNTLAMRFTTSFLFNQRSTYTIQFEVPVASNLNNGQWLQIEPEGWDQNNDAILRLRKLI